MRVDSLILFASKKRGLFPNGIPIWKRTLDILFATFPGQEHRYAQILNCKKSGSWRQGLGLQFRSPDSESGSSGFTQGRNQFILQGDKEVDHDSRTEAGFRTEQCGSGAAVI
jgi:hypothetical protein